MPRLILLALITLQPIAALAGGVLKVDDTSISGNIGTFDGQSITITSTDPSGQNIVQKVPIGEVVQVRFDGDFATAPKSGKQEMLPPSALLESINAALTLPPQQQDVTPQPIVLRPRWQIMLFNGDQISGTLESWRDETIVFDQEYSSTSFNIPPRYVGAIWHANTKQIDQARQLKIESPTEDVAYVVKDTDIIAVKGTAIGVRDDALLFRYEGEERKINLSRLLGVVLVRPKTTPGKSDAPAALYHTFQFKNLDQISGTWTQMEAGNVYFKTLWNQPVQTPASMISAVDARNGRLVYLSDLKPAKVEQTPYFDRIINWRTDSNLDGKPIKLGEMTYEHGIAMHSRCVLEYELNGEYTNFKSRVGLEQIPGVVGRVLVRVMIDGRALYEESDLRSDQKPHDLDLDIRKGKRLVLEIGFGEDQDVADRVLFANARLLRAESGK